MLKRATPSHPPIPARPLRRLSEASQDAYDSKDYRLPLKTPKILHQMPNRVIQQGRREPAD